MAAEWLFFEVCMGISDVYRTVCTALPEAVVGIQIYAVRYWPERCEEALEAGGGADCGATGTVVADVGIGSPASVGEDASGMK